MRDRLRFLMGGEVREIRQADPTETVLNWLRKDAARRGTKEGCGEGDCGSCTVLIGDLVDGDLRYQAVNACIQFMPTLDGKHLVTIEDLKSDDGRLHAVQQALVEEHGSQCGFCTPGFAMSLYGFYLNQEDPTVPNLNDALAGNLCRCTGYGPIVKAGQRMFALESSDRIAAAKADVIKILQKLSEGGALTIDAGKHRLMAPRTSAEFASLYDAHPDATILSGGTDVGLWVTKQLRTLDTLIYLGSVEDLRRIDETDAEIKIWANVTLTEALPVLGACYPEYGELLRRFGGKQVRNVGTLCGNVANGSPIGDNPPVLIALNARMSLRRADATREIAVEDFFIDYGMQDRKPGEYVEWVAIPKPRLNSDLFVYKISKRFDQDISAVCGAFRIQMDGDRIEDARIAFGGMAATPKRAFGAEQALTGGVWDDETAERAMAALADDFKPINDMRATARYRAKVACNLLKKVQLRYAAGVSVPRLTSSMEGPYA